MVGSMAGWTAVLLEYLRVALSAAKMVDVLENLMAVQMAELKVVQLAVKLGPNLAVQLAAQSAASSVGW